MGETCKRFHAGRHRRGMPIVCGRPVYRDGECRAHWRLRIDAALAAARDEVARTLRPLVEKLDEIGPDPGGVFSFAANHGLVYAGPNYAEELAAARAAVVALDKLEGK